MVIDPNETWGQFISSIIEFKEPKMIPVDELPGEYNPENRRLNSLKTLVNWRGQNYIEDIDEAKEPKNADDIESTGLNDRNHNDIVERVDAKETKPNIA